MTLLALDAEPLPVRIVTGFLGSGKTTLLRRLLVHPDFADTAVIVNEFGEIGLDHVLVERSEETTLLLDNGCLCCALRSDLVTTLLDLLDRSERREIPAFRRVVIETSGLADPVPLLQTFLADPLRLSRFGAAGMVTCLDAVNGAGSLERHREARRQLALADTVVVTKGDLADAGTAAGEARRHNARARVLQVLHGEADPEVLLCDPGLAMAPPADDDTAHGPVVSLAVTAGGATDWCRLHAAIDGLVEHHGDRLLRLKGLLRVRGHDGPVAVDGVQHLFHRPRVLERWPPGITSSVLVAIAEGASADDLERWIGTALPLDWSRVRRGPEEFPPALTSAAAAREGARR